MISAKQQRTNRIQSIKGGLRNCKVLSKISIQVEAKEEKIRYRRQSLHYCYDPLEFEKLIRKYSDEDEEEHKMNINSFNQKYVLQEKIGEGANASVHKCSYKETKKKYAVKIMVMEQQHLLDIKKSFIFIKNLRNTSIIKYHALYFDIKKRLAFLVMEYFPFPNLLQMGLIQQEDLKVIFIQLLKTVEFLHQRKLCHRDIKPENILYNAELKKIKLIDFGVSAKTYKRGGHCDMLTIIGTSLYMAPEVYEGGGYDERIDMWAIGVTLYRMITGVTPFESEYHSEVINKIIKKEVGFSQSVWSKYSYFVRDITKRLLKDKQQRLSIQQAMNHLWFQNLSPKSSEKIRKKSSIHDDFCFPKIQSFTIKIQKVFNENKMLTDRKLSISQQQQKEQGQNATHRTIRRITVRRLNLIQNKQFELQDSSQQQRSPSTVTSKESNKDKF